MNKSLGAVLILLALIVGGVGGYFYGVKVGERKQGLAGSATPTVSTQADLETQNCLKQVLGEARYNQIAKDPNQTTAADQFKTLQCYAKE